MYQECTNRGMTEYVNTKLWWDSTYNIGHMPLPYSSSITKPNYIPPTHRTFTIEKSLLFF